MNNHDELALTASLLISRTETCKLLGLGIRKVDELIADGVIVSVTIGTRRLILLDGLHEWISNGCPVSLVNEMDNGREADT